MKGFGGGEHVLGQDNQDKILRARLTSVLTKAELNNRRRAQVRARVKSGQIRGWLHKIGAEKDMGTEAGRCRDRMENMGGAWMNGYNQQLKLATADCNLAYLLRFSRAELLTRLWLTECIDLRCIDLSNRYSKSDCWHLLLHM